MNRFASLLTVSFCFSAFALVPTTNQSLQAATVPFTEDFSTDVSDWGDASDSPLTFVATGGPDGSSYASTSFSLSSGSGAGMGSAVLFRGQEEFGTSGSSDGAFIGHWINDGARKLSAYVRHNAPVPLNYFFRGSGPFNFPGATAVEFVPVLPNTWTELTFNVTPGGFVSFEGSDFPTVFSNIGHVQLGVSIPDSLAGNTTPFTFDIDQVGISVPEPSTFLLGSLALLAFCGRSRSKGKLSRSLQA